MTVEALAPALVRDCSARIEAARTAAVAAVGGDAGAPGYWESVFERNAAEVLQRFPEVRLPPGSVVRYVYYGRERTDLLIRPLVTRSGLDLHEVRDHLDWHAAPDSVARMDGRPTRDVELLYRHFAFERTAIGYFTYWVVLQEIWGSARWVHSRLLADREAFETLLRSGGWQVHQDIERFEPCAVLDPVGGCDLVVLCHGWLLANTVELVRVRIDADQAIRFHEPVLIASGPKGYLV